MATPNPAYEFLQPTSLRGRAVVVTGAAGPLGRVLSDAFAACGADLVMIDLERANPAGLAREIAAERGVTAHAITCDFSDERSLRDAAARVLERGRVDALINNAGFTGAAASAGWAVRLEDQSADLWRMAIEINLTAPFLLTQALLPALKASDSGSVVNIASIYGLVGPDWSIYDGTSLGNPAAYAASKGGLVQLTRWLATSLAPSIRVNALALGGIERGQDARFVKEYVRRVPLRRMATEADICGPAIFLASSQSRYVTGQILAVDGGWTSW